MNDYGMKDAATSSVLTTWAGEAVAVRRTDAPVHKIDRTGLPIVGRIRTLGVAGTGAGAAPMTDQVQDFGAGGVVVPGIPPRGRPVRC